MPNIFSDTLDFICVAVIVGPKLASIMYHVDVEAGLMVCNLVSRVLI